MDQRGVAKKLNLLHVTADLFDFLELLNRMAPPTAQFYVISCRPASEFAVDCARCFWLLYYLYWLRVLLFLPSGYEGTDRS